MEKSVENGRQWLVVEQEYSLIVDATYAQKCISSVCTECAQARHANALLAPSPNHSSFPDRACMLSRGYSIKKTYHHASTIAVTPAATTVHTPWHSRHDPTVAVLPVAIIVHGWHHPGFAEYVACMSSTTSRAVRMRRARFRPNDLRVHTRARARWKVRRAR